MAATSAPSQATSLITIDGLKAYLQSVGGVELCTSLTKLSGGYVNLTCRSTRSDGSTVIIKYAQDICRANWPALLSADRARDEQEMLDRLAKDLPSITHHASGVDVVIGSPKGLGYFPEHHVQVIEDFPDTMDFESSLLEAPMDEARTFAIGEALGKWAKALHEWGRHPERAELRNVLANNGVRPVAEHSRHLRLKTAVSLYPDATAGVKDLISQLASRIEHDSDPRHRTIIHGDFWHGNILVPRNDTPILGGLLPTKVIDWELCRLSTPAYDIGLLFAECRLIAFFKARPEAMGTISGFLAAHGPVEHELAFDIILTYGAILMTVPVYIEDWEVDKGLEEACVAEGALWFERAWERNFEFFEGGVLSGLFE